MTHFLHKSSNKKGSSRVLCVMSQPLLMKNSLKFAASVILALSLTVTSASALGGDYQNGQKVLHDAWPHGMSDLVNSPQRVGGYFVNAEDIFFFAGNQDQFDKFLDDYVKLQGLTGYSVFIHEGEGIAKAPWDKSDGVKCDWMLRGCMSDCGAGQDSPNGYVLELHIWDGGQIRVEDSKLMKSIELERVRE